MSIKQISVFVESRPGHLQRNLELFRAEGINVRGYSCSDTGDYGIARFIVDDPERALAVLSEAGAAVTSTDIVCIRLEDEPGEVSRVFGVLANAGVNVTYSYSLISTYIAIKVEDAASAEALLEKEGFTLITQNDLM